MKILKPPVILFLLVVILMFTNITPGTILSGFDNLHPEFNISLNIHRSLFSVWQEYQGLGLVGGMGHASDLPRQIALFFLSFVFSIQTLRYIYHFAALFAGVLGVYVLLKHIVFSRFDEHIKNQASFIGALFYLFNLATVQMFYLPFEPYSHHFVALPWLLYTVLCFIERGDRKSLLYLFLANILATPQGYVATYFLVTIMVLALVLFLQFLKTRKLKETVIAISIFFITNAFWLLPNLYFVSTKAQVPVEAKINQMSTEDNFLKNKKFGDLANTMLLKGFWFDNVDRNKDGSMTYQMRDWILHMQKPIVNYIGYGLFTLSLIGMIIAWRKKLSAALLFVPVFLLSFTILSNDTPVFSQISSMFYSVPLFSQIFRFPFTKFAIVLSLTLSVFYSVSFLALAHILRQKIGSVVIFSLFLLLPLIFVYPVFLGKFFDNRNQVRIPKSYFQVFDFFAKQKNSRIANFPQYTFWGWSFYRWDYRGSGILWYGIKQPILDRAFDVWSKENENYYNEISYATYAGNQKLFDTILEKYQINWILIDDNIISYSSQKQIYFNKFRSIIDQSQKIKLAASFDNLHVYKVHLETEPKQFIMLSQNLPNAMPTYTWNNYDSAYLELGNYINASSTTPNNLSYYPFRSLFTGKNQTQHEFTVVDKGDYFSFVTSIPKELKGSLLVLPKIFQEEITELKENQPEESIRYYPQILLDKELVLGQIPEDLEGDLGDKETISEVFLPYIREGQLEVRVSKIKGYYSYESTVDTLLKTPLASCNPFNTGSFKRTKVPGAIQLTSQNSSNCITIALPYFSHRLGYIVTVTSKYTEGKSLLFSVSNTNSDHADLETYLPKVHAKTTSYFVLPPLEKYTVGYGLNIDNISIGQVKTVNELSRITVNPIPYRFLTSLKIIKNNDSLDKKPYTTDITVEHPNPSYYKVTFNKISELNNPVLVLSQSFDKGWKAYYLTSPISLISQIFPFIFGKELKDHVLVNNWENGWLIPNNELSTMNHELVVIYLPQYLEFIGFILLLGFLVRIALWKG